MTRLLLDENFPRGAVPGLAAAGHDVLMVADAAPSINDRGVLALALAALQTPPDGHFVVVTRDGMRRRPFSAGAAGGTR